MDGALGLQIKCTEPALLVVEMAPAKVLYGPMRDCRGHKPDSRPRHHLLWRYLQRKMARPHCDMLGGTWTALN